MHVSPPLTMTYTEVQVTQLLWDFQRAMLQLVLTFQGPLGHIQETVTVTGPEFVKLSSSFLHLDHVEQHVLDLVSQRYRGDSRTEDDRDRPADGEVSSAISSLKRLFASPTKETV